MSMGLDLRRLTLEVRLPVDDLENWTRVITLDSARLKIMDVEPASPTGVRQSFEPGGLEPSLVDPREDDGTSAERPALVRSEEPQKTSSSPTCLSVAR